jgi:hypothetical protein
MTAAHLRGPVVHMRNRWGCSNKVQYSSDKEARTQAKKMGRGDPYKCPHCGGWHITTNGRALPAGVRADG